MLIVLNRLIDIYRYEFILSYRTAYYLAVFTKLSLICPFHCMPLGQTRRPFGFLSPFCHSPSNLLPLYKVKTPFPCLSSFFHFPSYFSPLGMISMPFPSLRPSLKSPSYRRALGHVNTPFPCRLVVFHLPSINFGRSYMYKFLVPLSNYLSSLPHIVRRLS